MGTRRRRTKQLWRRQDLRVRRQRRGCGWSWYTHARLTIAPGTAAALWFAVLDNAIQALRGKLRLGQNHDDGARFNRNRRYLAAEAKAWVIARDDEPLGTFVSVCRELGLPTAQVRSDLLGIRFIGQTRLTAGEREQRRLRRVAA